MNLWSKLPLFVVLLLATQLWASDRNIPQKFEKNWTPKTVFFGVNQAWDYQHQDKTLITFYSRENYRPFDFKQFPIEKYKDELTDLRNSGLKMIGISDWKIDEFTTEKLNEDKILVKVRGTYKKESGVVSFVEWQVFDGSLYSQINLVQELTPSAHLVSEKETDEIFKGVLQL